MNNVKVINMHLFNIQQRKKDCILSILYIYKLKGSERNY